MKLFTLIIILLTLVACGSNTKDRVVAVKVGDDLYKPDSSAAMAIDTGSNERIVCEKRIVTGSHRKERTCSTVAEKARLRRSAEEHIRKNTDVIVREAVPPQG